MMRILKNCLALSLTVACLGFTSPTFAANTLETEIENLKAEVTSQQTEITTLEAEIQALQTHQVVQDPLPGECGTANGQTFVGVTPTTNLCLSGTASTVISTPGAAGRVSFVWTCTGLAGGSTASCDAYGSIGVIDPPPPCNPPYVLVNGSCVGAP